MTLLRMKPFSSSSNRERCLIATSLINCRLNVFPPVSRIPLELFTAVSRPRIAESRGKPQTLNGVVWVYYRGPPPVFEVPLMTSYATHYAEGMALLRPSVSALDGFGFSTIYDKRRPVTAD